MLGRDWFEVLVLHGGLVDKAGHVVINVSLRVVPGELYAAKKNTHHVDCNSVVLLQFIAEETHVVQVGNFDAKVINH
jgi:hypothetical protein